MNERLCEIVAEPGRVEAWVAVRPPFEPKGWQLEFRNELRAAVRALEIPTATSSNARAAATTSQPGEPSA